MTDRKDPGRLPGGRPGATRDIRRWARPLGHGAVVLAFVVAASLLITRTDGKRSQLSIADVGQPAKFDVSASQSAYVPDDVTTKRLRDEASRAVPFVYSHTPGARERQVALLQQAFSTGREGFARYNREVRAASGGTVKAAAADPAPGAEAAAAAADGGASAGSGSEAAAQKELARELELVTGSGSGRRRMPRIEFDGPTSAGGRALPAYLHKAIAKRLAHVLHQKYGELTALLPLTSQELEALSRTRFSREAEQIVVRLLSTALDSVVARDKVKFLVDHSTGIVLRGRGASSLTRIEKVVSPGDVLDVSSARAKITELAAELLPELPPSLREALASCARRLVVENLTFDAEATARERASARAAVARQFRHYPRGAIIVRQGDLVTKAHLELLAAALPTSTAAAAVRSHVGNGLFVVLLGSLCFLATRLRVVRRRPGARDYLLLGALALLSLFLVRFAIEVSEVLHDRWGEVPLAAFFLCIPFAVGPLLVRLVLSIELATLFSISLSILVAAMTGGGSYLAAFAFAGSFTAAIASGHLRQRAQLLRAGLWVGIAQVGATLCLALAGGQGGFPLSEQAMVGAPEHGLFAPTFLLELAGALCSGLLTGLFAIAIVPVVELVFGYTTTMKYQELGSLENPLLKELFLRAPGTYHHSVVAGSLAEAAAEAIGANGALARVGAYYHDVGKGKCPHYFAENQRGENPHDRLSPHMSALILRRHVDDGVEILRQHKLPAPIIDICAQHLGTTLTEFFFVKARRLADEQNTAVPEEADFRYSGPKPQFREAALVFIADSVEAAGRSLADPSQPKLDDMVRRIIRSKFVDGQLDECDLTLRDLDAIAKAMTRVLVAIHHTRPQYPSQQGAGQQSPNPQRPGPQNVTAEASAAGLGSSAEGSANGQQGNGQQGNGQQGNGQQGNGQQGNGGNTASGGGQGRAGSGRNGQDFSPGLSIAPPPRPDPDAPIDLSDHRRRLR